MLTEDREPIALEGDTRITEDGDSRVTDGASFIDVAEAEVVRPHIPASGWTGRLSPEERVQVIKTLAPIAQRELQALIDGVAEQRFNDDPTQEALEQLKRLHSALGQLIEAANQGKPIDQLLAAFGQNCDKLFSLLKQGTNVVVAAPAMTFGMVKLLAALCGTSIDGALVGSVCSDALHADRQED